MVEAAQMPLGRFESEMGTKLKYPSTPSPSSNGLALPKLSGSSEPMRASDHPVTLWMVEIPKELTQDDEAWIRTKLGPEDLSPERLPDSLHRRVRAERLLGRYYLRILLDQETEFQGKSWRFEVDPQGKPFIAHQEAARIPQINLSHTHGAILCGLSHHGSLGVDIENVTREVALDKLEARCFTPTEQAWIGKAPRRRDGFFRAWTLKEAYLKAIGTGMRTPLTSVEIYPNQESELGIYQEGHYLKKWRFETKAHQNFRMSLCTEVTEGNVPKAQWSFLNFQNQTRRP